MEWGNIDIGECQFADHVTLLTTSCAGAEEAPGAHHSAVTVCELTVSFSRSNLSMSIEKLKQLYRLSNVVIQDFLKDTVWVFTPEGFTW